MKKVTEGVYNFTGLQAGRVYMIEDEDGLTLIDAGLRTAAHKIVSQIEAHGREPDDVRRILITHAHPDHVGGLPELKELTGAEVLSSVVEEPIIEGRKAVPRPEKESLSGLSRMMWRPSERLPGTMVGRTLKDGEVLEEVMGGLQALATPGHAPGHLAFWQAERGILFCGDVVFNTFGLREPPAAFSPDMVENRRSLKRIAELDVKLLCLGHGEPLHDGAAQRLREHARKVGVL